MKEKKQKSIRAKVHAIAISVAVLGIFLASSAGYGAMLTMQSVSKDSLISNMEDKLNESSKQYADLTNEKLKTYQVYINQSVNLIADLYENDTSYADREVLPPLAENDGIYSMQRYLRDESVYYTSVINEIKLLGNLESLWSLMMQESGDLICTVYIATESGFLISYDKNAASGVTEGSYESYWDYSASAWYLEAKNKNQAIVTDIYEDSYGRGITFTLASPFYDGDEFKGVVCLDILASDLQTAISDIDVGEGSAAYLIGSSGNYADCDLTGTAFKNLDEFTGLTQEDKSNILANKEAVVLGTDGNYYSYSPIPSTNWKLIIYIPEDIVLEPTVIMKKTAQYASLAILFTYIIVTGLAVFFTNRFAKSITNPLRKLKEDVETISKGDLEYRSDVKTNDEIGELATAFNNMNGSLQKYISDLTNVTKEKERIGAELNVAANIQISMLPNIFPAFPDIPQIDIYATMNAAKEVGGDFYDFFMVDENHLAIVMADVSGKGVPAALFMVIGKTLIKDNTTSERDLGEVFSAVNNLLCESNSEGLFITAFEGVLDLRTGEFNFVNAGHEMPFISKNNGHFTPYKTRAGFVLAGMEDTRYRAGSMVLEPGDKIFQYTDGVTEATSLDNELYGMERLEAILDKVKDKKPQDILPAVKEDIDKFVGEAPQFDDITMLCLEFKERKQ